MAEEIDDNNFFREDFSTESDWEIYCSQLGDLFQKWDFSNTNWGPDVTANELFNCAWDVQEEFLLLLKKEISVAYYKLRPNDSETPDYSPGDNAGQPMHTDLTSTLNTFAPHQRQPDLHPLARWYGLRRFAVLRPSNQGQFLSNPAEFSFFLSAASVVAAEVSSSVPIFVQVYDPKWQYFLGVGMAPAMRTNFDLVSLQQLPMEWRYLSGLLTMFKEKAHSTYLQPAKISLRSMYTLPKQTVRISMHVPFSVSPLKSEDKERGATVLRVSKIVDLPYGYFPGSSTDMIMTCIWPEVAENLVFDSDMRSDFVPSRAPLLTLHQVGSATSYLSSCLVDYLKLYGSTKSLESYVGRNFAQSESGAAGDDASAALQRLTKSTFSQLGPRRRKYTMEEVRVSRKNLLPGPMNELELNRMVNYLFDNSYMHQAKADDQECDPMRIKSALPDSFVCRLSCLLATCYAHFGGESGLAQLWAAFVRELRMFWDYCLPVPGIAAGFPDMRTCLLHQKLQMLNVCIQRRELRETEANPKQTIELTGLSTSSEDEDEFYDCSNNEGDGDSDAAKLKEEKPLKVAEGRLKRVGTMFLLDHEDEPLYVPVTQEPVPKTEDQLEADAEVMLKLGPGSGLTTQMMCSSLRSDMEAFKAANPKAKMEDFIRWYSPNDWLADEDGDKLKGKLSARMVSPGNTWQTVWNEARPVAAWRQKRLFDDTIEALKVLHYLETRNLGEIYELTVISIIHSGVLIVKDLLSSSNVFDVFSERMESICRDLCRLSRDTEVIGYNEIGAITQTPNPEPLIKQIRDLEEKFYQYKCFEKTVLGKDVEMDDEEQAEGANPTAILLNDIHSKFKEILSRGQCNLPSFMSSGGGGGGIGDQKTDGVASVAKWLQQQLHNANWDMRDNLISKDYVIRQDADATVTMAATTNANRGGPQFLRAIITAENIRLCGAFTESTTFI